ncbi:MAG: hypothetical protein QOD09_3770, partial [Bradyrhizobium sp.]|nr:hypothetical protein [Bradyrhizobium sp.]
SAKRSAAPGLFGVLPNLPLQERTAGSTVVPHIQQENIMKAIILVAALATAALASPAAAQEVIYNPGYCAQFYPNANCQNKGPGNPYTGNYRRGWHNGYAWAGPRPWRHRHHRYYRGY